MSTRSYFLFLILALVGMQSCKAPDLNVFERNVAIPAQSWSYHFLPSVDFNVSDTIASYNVLVVCRHTEAYAYKNLWVLLDTRKPGEIKTQKERFELTLQDNTGRWYGTGMDDIWEQRIPLYQNLHFDKPGVYTVTFEQNMRDEPLKGILDIGLRVEKAP